MNAALKTSCIKGLPVRVVRRWVAGSEGCCPCAPARLAGANALAGMRRVRGGQLSASR
jgi:hypothetical protein